MLKKFLIGALLLLSAGLSLVSYYFLFYNPAASARDKYEITLDEVIQLREEKPVYFIDIREPEFFEAYYRIKGAVNLRRRDIKDLSDIKDILDLNEVQAGEALFVLYCFIGGNSQLLAHELSDENVKYLKGAGDNLRRREEYDPEVNLLCPETKIRISSVFDEKIRDYDFNIGVRRAIEGLRENSVMFVDERYDPEYPFPFAFRFHVDGLSEYEYTNKLDIILENIEKDIIFISHSRKEFKTGSLILIQRLMRDYGFSRGQFHVLKGKDYEFYHLLKKEGLLNE